MVIICYDVMTRNTDLSWQLTQMGSRSRDAKTGPASFDTLRTPRTRQIPDHTVSKPLPFLIVVRLFYGFDAWAWRI